MSKARGLGRGFDSLIPTEVTADMPVPSRPAGGEAVQEVDPAVIAPNPHQPRNQFDTDELKGLADSIRHHGVLHPLVVSDLGSGRYELIAGERRLRASKLAGLNKIPVIVRSYSQQQKLELALLENLQRAELNPLETAVAYRKLADEFNLTLDQISQRMGKAKSTVANVMRLLQLPAAAQEAVASGAISEAHGRALLAVTDPAAQAELLRHVTEEGWTVRRAEEFARDYKTTAGKPALPARRSGGRATKADANSYVAKELGDYLGTKVTIQSTAKGGRLVIEYYSDEELQRLFETIKRAE